MGHPAEERFWLLRLPAYFKIFIGVSPWRDQSPVTDAPIPVG